MERNFLLRIFRAVRWSLSKLEGMSKAERLGALGSCLGDIVEYSHVVIMNLVAGFGEPIKRSKRWLIEDDAPELGKGRRKLLKELRQTMKSEEEKTKIFTKAKECVVGCAFEMTAAAAVSRVESWIQGGKKK